MSEASELLIVLCTFPDSEKARQIGTVLVEKQLAACANLLPRIESIYRWQGKIELADEVLVVFKTTAAAFGKFSAKLTELHPYELPEILAIQPSEVTAAYARWVISETCSSAQ